MIKQTIDEDEQRRRVAVLSLATKDAEIARLTRERDEAMARLAEADSIVAYIRGWLPASYTTKTVKKLLGEALARHAARAKGDG